MNIGLCLLYFSYSINNITAYNYCIALFKIKYQFTHIQAGKVYYIIDQV